MAMGILYGGILPMELFPMERVALSLIQVILNFEPFVQQLFKMMMMKKCYGLNNAQCSAPAFM